MAQGEIVCIPFSSSCVRCIWGSVSVLFLHVFARAHCCGMGLHVPEAPFTRLEQQDITCRIRALVNGYTEPWGIDVSGIEIRDINVPSSMQRVMAAVAEATREGEAKVVTAKADLEASHTFVEAAEVLGRHPAALQLRYFQTLQEIASERTSTIILPTEVQGIFRELTGKK